MAGTHIPGLGSGKWNFLMVEAVRGTGFTDIFQTAAGFVVTES